jgi:hypothetical protein
MSETTPSEFFATADRKAAFPATHSALEQVAILLDYSPVALLVRAVRGTGRLIEAGVLEPAHRYRREHRLREIGLTRAEVHAAAVSIFERQ